LTPKINEYVLGLGRFGIIAFSRARWILAFTAAVSVAFVSVASVVIVAAVSVGIVVIAAAASVGIINILSGAALTQTSFGGCCLCACRYLLHYARAPFRGSIGLIGIRRRSGSRRRDTTAFFPL